MIAELRNSVECRDRAIDAMQAVMEATHEKCQKLETAKISLECEIESLRKVQDEFGQR